MRLTALRDDHPRALASPCARRRPRSPVPVALSLVLVLGNASLAVAQTPDASSDPSAAQSRAITSAHAFAGHVAEAARRFGIPEAWIWSVMRVESAGNPVATSHAGAMGLMQVMPGTYAELRARHGLGPDAYDPRDNVLAGAAYLREMHDRYGATGMLAAYNAGPGRWEDYISRGRPLPAETIAYMARLGSTVGGSAAPSPTIVAQVDRFAWRRASLFVQLAQGASSGSDTVGRNAVSPQDDATPIETTLAAPNELTNKSTSVQADVTHALFAVRGPR